MFHISALKKTPPHITVAAFLFTGGTVRALKEILNYELNSVHEIRWEFVSTLNFSVHQGLKVGAGSAASCTKCYFTAPNTPNTQKLVDVGAVGQYRGTAGARDQGALV